MDRENAFGDADVRLLSTVAASMGVALENARLFDETQRLLKETERRSSELAVINSIQQGMARELNFQAIVDLVGDKLREMFGTGDLASTGATRATEIVHHPYVYEHGERLGPRARSRTSPKARLNQAVADAAARSCWATPRRWMPSVSSSVPAPTPACSCVFVPVMVGERLIAAISIESFEREQRVRRRARCTCCPRSPQSMGVALENARLLDGNAAQRARIVGVVGRRPRPVVDARPRDGHGPHRRPCQGVARRPATAPFSCLMATAGATARIVALGDLAGQLKATAVEPGRGIIGSLIAERPAGAHQRHRGRPARGADRGHRDAPRRPPDGGAAARRRDGAGRDGGVAQRRQPVRGARARFPGGTVAAGGDRTQERAALPRDAGGAGAADRQRPRCCG